MQSRVYTKNLGTYAEERTAYEVSIMRPAEPEEFLPEPPPEPSADFVRSAKSENFLLTNGRRGWYSSIKPLKKSE